jgi:hypothetical protein
VFRNHLIWREWVKKLPLHYPGGMRGV